MCTALTLKTKCHYFGRNLDLDRSYEEEVCIMPRNFPVVFSKDGQMNKHCAIIGMSAVVNEVPLFYDATNEYGLSMAGLNFPENAYYSPLKLDKVNVAPFEFITWILCHCKSIQETKLVIEKINLTNTAFSQALPLSPLHWIISDKDNIIIVEFMKDGLHLHENPLGVLTNNPPFEYQLSNFNKYINLKTDNSEIIHHSDSKYSFYSQGLGAIGLPGDVSSMSRFIRASFYKQNSVCNDDEMSSVTQFFHLLSSVEMVRGICKTDEGKWDITGYSSCINTDKGLYYYTTYENRQINCVDMYKSDINSNKLFRYPLLNTQSINYIN